LAAYAVCIDDGRVLLARHVPSQGESSWTLPGVARLRRSSLVDVGLALAQTAPATGHVASVPVGGLIQH
jgi:hypothetical protein